MPASPYRIRLRFADGTADLTDRPAFAGFLSRLKILALQADEFLRRLLLHVVPRGFMRICHFGLLANRTRRETLTRCRSLLGQPPTEEVRSESVAELMHRLTGIDVARCPVCGEGRMHVTAIVAHATPPPDTSWGHPLLAGRRRIPAPTRPVGSALPHSRFGVDRPRVDGELHALRSP